MVSRTTPAAGFRPASDLAQLVASMPRTLPVWAGEVGPRWRVTFSPGAVQVGTRDLGRLELSANRRRARALRPSLCDAPTVPDLALTAQGEDALRVPPKRGKVTGWSRKSVANMARMLAALDYAPLLGDGTRPAMLTLTLPGEWESVAGTPQRFRSIVNRFRSRYSTAWGATLRGVWKLEFQRRGAPHLHVLISVPEGSAPRPLTSSEAAHVARCARPGCLHSSHDRPALDFRAWVAEAWALSVGHADPLEFERNRRAGVRLDVDLSMRYGDAKRVAVYFAKHGAFADKWYQNELPASWRSALESGEMGARFWGYWDLKPTREVLEVDPALIICIARHLRKLEASRSYSRRSREWRSRPIFDHPPFCQDCRDGARAARARGERWRVSDCPAARVVDRRKWRPRRVTRRVAHLRNLRGFLSVNDGYRSAESVARLLRARLADDWFSTPAQPVPARGLEVHGFDPLF